jgi:hypothetical protein
MTRLKKILRRGWRDRLWLLEAFACLSIAKIMVHTVPFRWYAPRLGRTDAETTDTISPAERALAVKVSWAVQAAARHAPLGFVCLPQALAAKWMLQRRGLPSTLYFGVALNAATKSGMLAHAWVRAGDKILTGEREAAHHVVVARFAGGA